MDNTNSNKIQAIFFIFISLCLIQSSVAEYRVYQYYVKAKSPYSLDQKAQVATSTLDPVSYLAYNGGNQSIKIDLLRTWMCFGYTARQQLCPPPSSYTNQVGGINEDQ